MTRQNRPIIEMKNLGPRSSEWLAEIDIRTEADLRERGVINTYLALRAHKPRANNLMMLWALQGAVDDINCLHLPDDIKEHLKEMLTIAENENDQAG